MANNDVSVEDELRNQFYAYLKADEQADTWVIPYRVADVIVRYIEIKEHEAELRVEKAQLDFLISNIGTVTLRGYGGEVRGELKCISLEQLKKYRHDIDEELTAPTTNNTATDGGE